MSTVEQIKSIINSLFENNEFHLVDIELRGSGPSQVLSVYADTDKGITLEQITYLTQQISDILDMNDVIPGRYRLEVSSPGLNRPLKHLWQYQKNIGRQLRVQFEEDEGQKEITGELTSVNENEVIVNTKKQEFLIPIKSILKANVKAKF